MYVTMTGVTGVVPMCSITEYHLTGRSVGEHVTRLTPVGGDRVSESGCTERLCSRKTG